MTSQKIATVELLGRQQPQASYRIEEVDSSELGGNLDAQPIASSIPSWTPHILCRS